MEIPNVSELFASRLSAAGLGRAETGDSQDFASTLAETQAQSGDGAAGGLTVEQNADAATQAQTQALGWTPPQKLTTGAAALLASSAYNARMLRSSAYAVGPASGTANSLVAWAKQFVGTPYVRGGEDLLKGTDCSGFTQSVFKQFGVELPRSAYRQSQVGTPVDPNNLQPGDLMFFKTDDYAPVTHVAIYVGDGKILHASSVKTGVIISKLKKNWQNGDFVCAKRML